MIHAGDPSASSKDEPWSNALQTCVYEHARYKCPLKFVVTFSNPIAMISSTSVQTVRELDFIMF